MAVLVIKVGRDKVPLRITVITSDAVSPVSGSLNVGRVNDFV